VFNVSSAKNFQKNIELMEDKWHEHDGDVFSRIDRVLKMCTKYKFAIVLIIAVLLALLVCCRKNKIIIKDIAQEEKKKE
jgi:hypothetical protein